jgi:hypothetical protein
MIISSLLQRVLTQRQCCCCLVIALLSGSKQAYMWELEQTGCNGFTRRILSP